MVLEGIRSGENQQPLKEELMYKYPPHSKLAVSLSDKTGQTGLPNRSDQFLNQLAVERCQCPMRTMCGSRTGGWSLPCVMSD
jgi:hypothetical protein